MTSFMDYLSPVKALSSLFGNPPASNVPTPQINAYQPQNFSGADAGAFGGIGNLSGFNMYPGMMQQAQGVTQNLFNDPNAQGFQQGAGQASQMGQAGAMGAFGAGGGLMNMGGQIANTAFDPQQALYGRTVQQLQDQTRAGEAARGIAMTPYGAGLENQAMSNFNIDWQNQQLQRQMAGGQAAGSLIGQGAGMQAGAPGQYLQASGMPYATSQGIGQGQFGALSNMGQFGTAGSQIPQQQIADYQNYLGWGTGQQGMGNQAQLGLGGFGLNQSNQAFNQQQTMFGDLGKVAGAALPFLMMSDERVKDDIVPVGELYDRTPVYSFRYKGDPTSRVGLMAQDVERRRPDAVREVNGFKAVDYAKATEFSRGIAALSNWG